MTLDFCAIVEPLAPKWSAISADDVFSRELLLNMKLMLQMVYTEAAAHIRRKALHLPTQSFAFAYAKHCMCQLIVFLGLLA